jgi:long-chain acyl-CoA synthetase
MDTTPYETLDSAPAILFARLPERRARPRFMVRTDDGAWRPISWQAHADAVKNVAGWLAGLRPRPGDRGAVFAPNAPQWMEAALGIQAAGMAMVPIYPASTPAQAGYVVEHSDARVVFVATEELLERVLLAWPAYEGVESIVVMDDVDPGVVLERLRDAGDRVPDPADVDRRLVSWARVQSAGAARHEAEPEAFARGLAAIDLDRPAIMLYTSGTTGNPKGVPLTHRNVGVNGIDWLRCNAPALHEDGVDLLWLPMSHVFGFGEACIGNNLGFTTYLASAHDVLGLMPSVRPTVFMSVPAYWEKLAGGALAAETDADAAAALAEATGGRLRFCLSGGAGLARPVKDAFARGGITIIEGYGLTECSPTLTLNRPHDFRFDSVGKPLPSVDIRLGDDGEILARGPSIFAGYHKDPEATRAAFTDDGWFRTGDLGRFTDDGFLQIVGRKKDILVTAGGKNVPPANVEGLFTTDPLFSHVVVYGDGKKYLVAGVWLDESVVDERLAAIGKDGSDPHAREALVQAAVDAANAKLARFEQIKRFRIMQRPLTVASGLLTSTLKIRRAQIYDAFRDAFEGLYA